ncbi:MAG: RIP metalloprotease RseP [Pseudomonadota bacterium]
MANGLLEILAYVLVISVLVTVHEFGHFWVARRLGFKVLRFSIGFGRPLASRVGRDGVEYVLSAIPLGGYVRLADERDGPVAPEDLPRTFTRRPIPHRIAVLLAGAGANFLFAWLAYSALYLHGVPGIRAIVADIHAGSLADAAGLRSGDEIVAVRGHAVRGVDDAVMETISSVLDNGAIRYDVRRGSDPAVVLVPIPSAQRRGLTEPGELEMRLGFAFVQPIHPAVIGALSETSSAKAAGLQVGDEVLSVDGRAVANFSGLRAQIIARAGQPVTLRIRRAGAERELPVSVAGEPDPSAPGRLIGRLGILPGGQGVWPAGVETVERYGPVEALLAGGRLFWKTVTITGNFVRHMVTGKASSRNVTGPFGIAKVAALSLLAGWPAFLSLLAGISIGLGILNLLPLPLLDGGQVVYQLFEAVTGGSLSDRTQGILQRAGFAILILLTVLAVYNDLSRPG